MPIVVLLYFVATDRTKPRSNYVQRLFSKLLNDINEGFEPGPSRLRVEHSTVFHLRFPSQILITLNTPICSFSSNTVSLYLYNIL